MEKFKKLKITLISVFTALLLAVSATAFLIFGSAGKAYASPYTVDLDGNTVFFTPISSERIISESEEVKSEADAEKTARYTLFKIGKDQTVSYRQNLAYSWISGVKDGDGNYTGEHRSGLFSMKLSFASLNFKRFIIKFQSQQYVMTKDNKSENYLVFEPSADARNFTIKVCQSLDKDDDGNIKEYETLGGSFESTERVEIGFEGYEEGDYRIYVNDQRGQEVWFKNVYEHFATYVSSGDNAVTPLAFSAEFAEGEEDNTADMILYDISGQSFEMFEKSSGYRIEDNAAPVICFSQTPSYLEYGKSIGLQYKVIDVLAQNPGATAYYYILTGDQYKNEDEKFDYDKTDYDSKSEDSAEGDKEEEQKSPFIRVTSSSGARLISDSNTFIPKDHGNPDKYSNVCGLVKLYYEIYDRGSTSSTSQKDRVFVNWYAPETALVDIYGSDLKNDQTGKESYFLKLIDEKQGVSYARAGDETGSKEEVAEKYKKSVETFQNAYQDKIDKAIAALEDGKLYAGGDKFYLPAIESVDFGFVDEYGDTRDYKYSIYYKGKTTGSHTSLEANKLAIDLNDADVTYRFTIFITDAMGNPMRYPAINDEGELVWEKITTNDVWDKDFAQLLPYFEFDVSYKKATVEDPKDLSLSYVGTNYSGVSFKITGVTGTYESQYKLYVFDRNAMNKDLGKNLEYADFNSNVQKLFDNTYIEGVNTRKYFTTVKPASELLETDEHYEEFKALNWNPTSISFTPQTIDDFYVVELQLTDTRSQSQTVNYATVAAAVQTKALKGESDWLENNKTSVILLSIAGACLIALIVLLIIKPKDKGDIDAVYSEEVERADKKAKNKKKKAE